MHTAKKAAIVLAVGLATGIANAEPDTTPVSPDSICCNSMHDQMVRMIEAQTFFALPESHRERILKRCELEGIELSFMTGGEAEETNPNIIERSVPLSEEEYAEAYEAVKDVVDEGDFKSFKPIHQRMLGGFARLIEENANDGVPVMPCFAPGTDQALINAFEDVMFGVDQDLGRFQQTTRWGGTALNPGGAAQGDPTILTYSFPDDGTTIPNGVGEGQGPNGLNAFMDGIYGNRATWRALYDQIFARWGELSGNTYILETNDDNSTFFNNPGVAGVRGDLRMGGKPIDGNSGILAYNFFPQNGDMVVDSPDSFYNNTTGQSLRLRNVLAHEHGHGMGQLHVCPTSQTKLMEPFISVAYDGPQFDDTLNAQRHYGDPQEPNDNIGEATDLGSFNIGQSIQLGSTGANNSGLTDVLSIDDNSDSDYFLLNLNSNGSITATVTPRGFTYLDGPQVGNCDSGSNYNALNQKDLGIQVLDSAGTVIQSVNDNGLGQAETVVANASSGAAYVRVFGGNENTIQSYTLNISVDQGVQLPLSIEFIGTPPSLIEPDQTTLITALLELNDDSLIGSPELVFQRAGDASPTTVSLTGGAGGVYTGNLPAFDCGDDPTYFVQAEGTIAGVVTDPDGAPIQAAIGTGTSVVDNSETDIGWTVTGSATEGQWTRGFPQGNDRSDPAVDADGSGQAWLTGIEAGDPNSDVDGGDTIMTSPAFDFSSGGTISYSYWMNDETNTIGAEDYFRVEISTNNGGSWSIARTYTTATVWRSDTIDVGSEFGNSNAVRIRFAAADNDPGDVLECGVDAVEFESFECEQTNDCLADVNGDGAVTPTDFTAWVNAFNNNLPECDQNGDGMCTPTDFTAWVNNFNAGCP
ncbi:MAG: hypothetical protein ED559_00015 [Phycisphaera sp.]|nr:MAG: hypothetical protein ED559_00015 [Phycisphaera sp.]